jgi:hypothetical protein
MTDDRTLERAARSWLEEGPTQAPDRAVDAALSRIQTTRQERDLVPWRFPAMQGFTRSFAGLAVIAVVLFLGAIVVRPGFGPGAVPTPSPTPTGQATTPVGPVATASDRACRLLTTDEVIRTTTIADQGAASAASGTDADATCVYSTGGFDIVLQLTYVSPGGRAAFDAAKGTAGFQAVTGIGAEAVYDPTSRKMYVVKGDALVTLASGMFVTDYLAAETTLAKLVAARL